MFFRLAYKSLLDRTGSVLLTLLAISVSIFVLLGIEHTRQQAKENFSNSVSGTDLIVGARTSSVNLLLYSVFRIGNATNNISWDTYQRIANSQAVSWTIPIALGDSHRGYRVMGTHTDYFNHFRYGKKRPLTFTQGKPFDELFDVVLGAEVARKLGYQLGDQIVLSHGTVSTSFSNHDNNPFTVVGILKPTGTPVDQTLHTSLEAIEAIHIDWQDSAPAPSQSVSSNTDFDRQDLTPKSITAFMIGLESKMLTFRLQRQINDYPNEALLAILPGVTLAEFWQTLSITENTLRFISLLVLVAALLGLSALLLTSIRERQREIAIIRALGASPWFLFLLIQIEAILITLSAAILACLMLFIALKVSADQITTNFGLYINANFLSKSSLLLLFLVLISSMIVCLIPAISAYRNALHKALSE